MFIKPLMLIVCLMFPLTVQAQSTKKYFGYFGGDYTSVSNVPDLHEFQDHANLYSIQFWSGTSDDKSGSEIYILGELERARQAHVHAMVGAYPFVFLHSINEAPFHLEVNASVNWNSFVQKMVDRHLLIPGDPERSTVVAIYLVDEPNGVGGLQDQNGAANPALVNAVNAIRGNAATASLPIASILTPDFNKMPQGIKLLDWVGFDDYGASDSSWTNTLNSLENSYAPGKKYIIVPGSLNNCDGVKLEASSRYIARMESDQNVVWLAPFLWLSDGSCKGVRDIPSLRSDYTLEGKKIKEAQCASSRSEKWFCGKSVDISGAINLILNN